MKTLIDQSGIVAESDYISLSRTVTLKGKYLIDTATGAKNLLNPKAIKSIELLELPTPYDLWLQYSLRLKISYGDILEILLFLNSIGALEIKRSVYGRKKMFIKRLKQLSNGLTPVTILRRRPANLVNINLTVLSAMRPLFIAIFVVYLMAYSININTRMITLSTTSFLITIWSSTVIHEQVHSFIIARKKRCQVLLQRGLRMGILHKTLPSKTEFASAIMGPTTGALSSLLCSIVLTYIFGEIWLLEIGFLVMTMQLISLLPAYGDGQVIWANLKEKIT